MKYGRIAICLAVSAVFVCAQNDIKPEIRGTVTDPSLNIGIAGAEITLSEFLLDADKTVVRTQIATTSTGTRGEFRFPLDHFGEYFVEVKKEGYSIPVLVPGNPPETMGTRADVDRDRPAQDLRFSLTQLGNITGRVVDEDGDPVAGQRIVIQDGSAIPPDLAPTALTDQNGSFTIGKLPAGQYLVRLTPKSGDFETATAQFTDDDLKIVDLDVDPEAGAPVPVSPGATSSMGTITVHKVPYYRAHVTVRGVDCEPREGWKFSAVPKSPPFTDRYFAIFPCANEFLIRNLKPGSYWFVLRSESLSNGRSALADVEVSRENVDVSMVLTQAAEIHGRFVAAEGVTLAKFQQAWIMMSGRFDSAFGTVDSEGRFTIRNLLGIPHDVTVQGLGGRYYVKEIRYNGVGMPDGLVTTVPGPVAQDLEIVVDDKAATITGSVRDGDKPVSKPFVLIVKWPVEEGDPFLSAERPNGDEQGKFQISGLGPGEYRVLALTKNVVNTQISIQLLSRGEKVTLERGNVKDITLTLIDPSQ